MMSRLLLFEINSQLATGLMLEIMAML